MRLSSQKDLLLVIIMSLVVLTLNWLQLIKGSAFTFIQYVIILLGPGYAIITAIWPTDDRINWSLRAGMGFVLGLFFILFLPIIFTYLKLEYLTPNFTKILLILAIIFSLVAMARRREPEEETLESDSQLTLEESIQRVREMEGRTEKAEFVEYEHEEELYPDEYYEEEPKESPEEIEEYSEEINEKKDEEILEEELPKEIISKDEIPEKYRDLKEEKPLQYERIKDKYVDEDYPDKTSEPSPFRVEEPVKTEPVRTEYEREMDKPVWPYEESAPKSRFKYWDLLFILFLSGVSLLFLYFNPLETSTTSITFFIVLLFILGYASVTIIFPDKSKVSARNLIMVSMIIALILFVLSFMAFTMQILPTLPKYMVRIMFITSLVLVASAFLRKWLSTRKKEYLPEEKVAPEERVTEEKVSGEEEETKEKIEPLDEKVPLERPVAKKEKENQVKSFKTPTSQVTETVTDERIYQAQSTYKPRNYYIDIISMFTLTLLTAAFVLIPPLNKTFIRTILGILLVLFIPGYSLIAALFPKWGDLDGIERVALSFGLSIAVTPLIGLALNYTPWGIRLDPILISLTIFTMAMCLIAFLRRKKLPEKERFFVPFGGFFKGIKGSFQAESRTEKILSIILIISIILAISTTAYIIVKPKQGEKFTEFYILGPEGKASDYPTNLTSGQNGSVIIGVVNHEYATKDYQLVVKVNETILKNDTITLTNGQKMEIPFSFIAGGSGEKKMEFLLYKLPDQENVYRSLHLWLNIQ